MRWVTQLRMKAGGGYILSGVRPFACDIMLAWGNSSLSSRLATVGVAARLEEQFMTR